MRVRKTCFSGVSELYHLVKESIQALHFRRARSEVRGIATINSCYFCVDICGQGAMAD